jgi:hypothetical protein
MVSRFGISGVPWAMVVAYVALVAVPLGVLGLRGRLAPPKPGVAA